jgi:microsomal prostaglandin-E synthase 2
LLNNIDPNAGFSKREAVTTAQKSQLYQYEVCPFCWKVRVGLALKKVPYEKIEVHPLNKKELAFSDYKKVPVYKDSAGIQVNDSNAILKHIDEEYTDGPKLCAADGTAAKEAEKQWLEWSEKYVKAVPPLIYDTVPNALKAFDYITKVGNFSSLQKFTIKYSGAIVMKMVAKKSKERQNISDPKAHIKKYLQEWADAVGTKPFRGGDTPDITDAAVFGITLSVKDLPAYPIMQEVPAFAAWMKRMSERTNISV